MVETIRLQAKQDWWHAMLLEPWLKTDRKKGSFAECEECRRFFEREHGNRRYCDLLEAVDTAKRKYWRTHKNELNSKCRPSSGTYGTASPGAFA
jgi:hypothetical protein